MPGNSVLALVAVTDPGTTFHLNMDARLNSWTGIVSSNQVEICLLR
jgi:hypothetical protein